MALQAVALPTWAERRPDDVATAALELAYAAFAADGAWPTLAGLDAGLASGATSAAQALGDAPLGVFWPDPAAGGDFAPGQTVAATLFGLTFVDAAADDVRLYLDIYRWAAGQAQTAAGSSGFGATSVPLTMLLKELSAWPQLTPADIARVLTMIAPSEPNAPSLQGTAADAALALIAIPPDLREVYDIAEYLEMRTPRPQRQRSPDEQRRALAAALETADTASSVGGDGGTPEAPASLLVRPRTSGDLAAAVDRLGFTPLVAGLVDLVNASTTSLPLAVAITGEWGAGKSSMMRQLADRLTASAATSAGREWVVVEFDAWKYQRGESLWAALTKAIYEGALAGRSRSGRIAFKTRLEWERQGRLRWTAKLLAPFAVLAAALVYVIAFAPPAAAGGVAGIVGAAAVGGAIAAAARGIGSLGSLVADPFKRAIDLYGFRGRFQQHLGFSTDAASDVDALTKQATDGGAKALAVFIDDLDRCSPSHVVEVVEAVNQIFNASRDNQTLFVLGMDLDVVIASIEAAYAETITKLPSNRQDFGRDYLRKVAQLFIDVPTPDERALATLLDSITAEHAAVDTPPSEDAVARAQALINQQAPATAADVTAAAEGLVADGAVPEPIAAAAVEEAQRRERSLRFGSDAADVAAAEHELVRFVAPNPRALKQFDTAYRLQLHVANDSPLCRLTFSYDQLVALGKWVVLRLRWPAAALAADDDPRLLEQLERIADEGLRDDDDARVRGLAGEAGLLELLRGDDARRLSRLPFESFLRVV
jgi:hypothetical protein